MATIVTDTVQRPVQLDYKLRSVVAPRYKLVKIPPNNIPSASVTIDPTTSVTIEWKLPCTRPYNTARSFIGYQFHVDATTAPSNKATWSHEDIFELGGSVSFGSAAGTDLVNLQYAQNYVKIARKIKTEVNDFLGNDDMSSLYRSNKDKASNIIPGGYDRLNAVKYVGVDSFIEPCASAASAAGTPLDRFRQFPLNAFVGTLLAVDRDFYSPVEQYFRIQAGVGDKMAFTSTAAADPATGAGSPAKITINNCYLYLAVEQNDEIVAALMQQYQSGQLQFRIPYTTSFKNVGGSKGAQTNISIPLSTQYGRRLKSVLHTVWNPQEKFNTAYDCANYDGEKIESYQTFLDNNPLQDRILSCKRPAGALVNQDDWAENKKFLEKRSCIMSKEQYALNWFHKDQFFEPKDKDGSLPEVNLDEGLLMDTQKQWIFQANIAGGAQGIDSLIHYTFAEFARDIIITPTGPVFL